MSLGAILLIILILVGQLPRNLPLPGSATKRVLYMAPTQCV